MYPLAKLTFGAAALLAAMCFGTSPSRAYGNAPWCAVITLQGDVYGTANIARWRNAPPTWSPAIAAFAI